MVSGLTLSNLACIRSDPSREDISGPSANLHQREACTHLSSKKRFLRHVGSWNSTIQNGYLDWRKWLKTIWTFFFSGIKCHFTLEMNAMSRCFKDLTYVCLKKSCRLTVFHKNLKIKKKGYVLCGCKWKNSVQWASKTQHPKMAFEFPKAVSLRVTYTYQVWWFSDFLHGGRWVERMFHSS